MMPDAIMKELWETKDAIAREHGYNVEALVAHLRARKRPKNQNVVDLRAERGSAGHRGSAGAAEAPDER
ncbi:MAG: hypothetical protein KJ060_15250 [Candidatus Hydrogenedentes bacterium]|nr:hypothetical protein [Candidatus Hydrogenedentota bacterium]